MPKEVAQGCGGREMTAVSILGPYLAKTVFTEDDTTVAEKFFKEKPNQAQIRTLTSQLQAEMESLRVRNFYLYFEVVTKYLLSEKEKKFLLNISRETTKLRKFFDIVFHSRYQFPHGKRLFSKNK